MDSSIEQIVKTATSLISKWDIKVDHLVKCQSDSIEQLCTIMKEQTVSVRESEDRISHVNAITEQLTTATNNLIANANENLRAALADQQRLQVDNHTLCEKNASLIRQLETAGKLIERLITENERLSSAITSIAVSRNNSQSVTIEDIANKK